MTTTRKKKAEAAARARAAAPPGLRAPAAPRPVAIGRSGYQGGGVTCQDGAGRRMTFPSATSCPYGLTPAR
jgi:hypothetical protein